MAWWGSCHTYRCVLVRLTEVDVARATVDQHRDIGGIGPARYEPAGDQRLGPVPLDVGVTVQADVQEIAGQVDLPVAARAHPSRLSMVLLCGWLAAQFAAAARPFGHRIPY